MSLAAVWVVIGAAQVLLAAAVGALHYATRSRRRAAELQACEGWMRRAVSGARSPLWWKRLAAARALAHVGGADDREIVLELLGDRHPGVQSAATASLHRYVDDALLVRVIDGLSNASSAVRAYQLGVLAEYAREAAPMLLDRIRADAPPHKLYAYIHAASALGDPSCMARVAELSTHPHPEVRVAVARALGTSSAGERVHVKLLAMLRDPDWRVRAQAARALAVARDERNVPELARALADPNWWVRFRAGLALASSGPAGQRALDAARTHNDRYARDMATLVAGLAESSVTELSAG